MQIKILSFILAISLFFSAPAWATALTDSALKDGIGVRVLGMGGAFTALLDDATAVFYNPAGLVFNHSIRIGKGSQDINSKLYKSNEYYIFNYGAIAFSNWTRTNLSGEAASVSSFSYARPGGKSVAWGLSYKTITGLLGNGKNNANSLDVGLLGNFTDNLYWGLLFQDIIDNAGLAGAVRVGLAYKLFPGLTLLGDVEYRNIKSSRGPEVYTHLGVEHKIMDGLVLRGGYDRERWTGGGSLYFLPVILEYALQASSGTGSQAVQMVGMKVEL